MVFASHYFTTNLCGRLTSRGAFDAEYRLRTDRRTQSRTDQPTIQPGGGRELLRLCTRVPRLSCPAAHPDQRGDRGAGGALPTPCDRDVPQTPWSVAGAVLALHSALWNPRIAAACTGPVAARAESNLCSRCAALCDLRRIRDLAARGTGPCGAQYLRIDVGGPELPRLAA